MMEKDAKGRSKQGKVQINSNRVGAGGLQSVSATAAP